MTRPSDTSTGTPDDTVADNDTGSTSPGGMLGSETEHPRPLWQHERSFDAVAEIRGRLRRGYRRYVEHRGNKVEYLRSLGVRIGNDCAILNTVSGYGEEPWLIEIGDRVTISIGVLFLTHDGASRVFRHLVPEGSAQYGNRFGPIRILDNSMVGANAILLPDVTVGPNSIVGTGSVVTKDVPPAQVAAGNPANIVCSLDEYVERYRKRMVPIRSTDRISLRKELTRHFFGDER